MTAAVLENMGLLTDAPGGVERLRNLIVELAVSGRLVAQVASDEPATQLAARLIAAKAKAITDGARRQKALDSGTDIARPFESPASWAWQTLDDLLLITGGVTLGRKLMGRALVAMPYLRVANVQRGFLSLDDVKEIEVPVDEVDKYELLAGDLLITEGGDWDKVGRTAIWRGDIAPCLHQNHVFRARACSDEFRPHWAELFLNSASARSYFAGSSKQTTNLASINMTQLRSCAFPLPPLAEQHRIVAKVDELMALCDRLEARQQDAEAAHARLVQALLDSLTQARDADEFQACWQRLARQFQALLSTDASIERLEAVVLQLAVTGRLTGRRKSFEAPADDAPDLPPLATGWAYRAFNDLIAPERPIAYGVLVPGPEVAGGVPFVRIADLSLQSPAELPEKTIARDVDAKFSRTRLVGGEILMGVVGSVGKLGVAPESWAGANIARAICRIVPAQGVNKDYVLLLLRSDLMRRQFLGDTRTLAQPTLNVGLIRAAKAPVPPLAEQAQVVHTAHELLALCDQLKARIAAARAKHAQLAEALVTQAVAA